MLHSRRPWLLGLLVIALWATSAEGQISSERGHTLPVVARPVEVTIYRNGTALVRRQVDLDLAAGRYALTVDDLPAAVIPETVIATAGAAVTVGAVRTEAIALAVHAAERLATLERSITEHDEAATDLDREQARLDGRARFLEAVTARAGSDAGGRLGDAGLDLDAVRTQMTFFESMYTALADDRTEHDRRRATHDRARQDLVRQRDALRDPGRLVRRAIVDVTVTRTGPIQLDLLYLSRGAEWTPIYVLLSEAGSVRLHCDARVGQTTGEDWSDVALVLSNARASIEVDAARPAPWFLDVEDELPSPGPAAPPPSVGEKADAMITYRLPGPVSVPSGEKRMRIATIETAARFVHVAAPLTASVVELRADLTNVGPVRLLPGTVSIFLDGTYVGESTVPGVDAGRSFAIPLGIDPAVTARRRLDDRFTVKTGLLGGGLRTTSRYRVDIMNASSKTILVELWDRIPVSRTDEVEVTIADLSHPLDADAAYLETDRPVGLLRWTLAVPPTTGEAPFSVTWESRVSRAKDVDVTPLPDGSE